MIANTVKPCPPLREFILNYGLREADLREAPLTLSFAPRNDQMLEVYLGDCPQASISPGAPLRSVPRIVVVGNQSVDRVALRWAGKLRTFSIRFRPMGFARLFGVPMDPLAGLGLDASGVLGPSLGEFCERLTESADAETMARIANRFLLPYVGRNGNDQDPFQGFVERELARYKRAPYAKPLDRLIESGCLSTRQFERKFKRSVGISPKRFLRIERFQTAANQKANHPNWSWGRVAIETGYYDQAHLVRDFQELAEVSPTEWEENPALLSCSRRS